MNRLDVRAATFGVAAPTRLRTRPIAEPHSGVRVLRSDGEVRAAVARAVEFERLARDGLVRRLDRYAQTLEAAPPSSVLHFRRRDDADATAVRQSA